jgi:hypothetical protein
MMLPLRCPLPMLQHRPSRSHPSVSGTQSIDTNARGWPEPSGKAVTRAVCRPRCARPKADGSSPLRSPSGWEPVARTSISAEQAGEGGGVSCGARPAGYARKQLGVSCRLSFSTDCE